MARRLTMKSLSRNNFAKVYDLMSQFGEAESINYERIRALQQEEFEKNKLKMYHAEDIFSEETLEIMKDYDEDVLKIGVNNDELLDLMSLAKLALLQVEIVRDSWYKCENQFDFNTINFEEYAEPIMVCEFDNAVDKRKFLALRIARGIIFFANRKALSEVLYTNKFFPLKEELVAVADRLFFDLLLPEPIVKNELKKHFVDFSCDELRFLTFTEAYDIVKETAEALEVDFEFLYKRLQDLKLVVSEESGKVMEFTNDICSC